MEDRWQTHLWRGAQAGRDRRVHSLPASSTTGGSEQAAENRGFERPGGEEMRRLLRKNGSGKSSVLPEVHNEQRWEEQARIISAPLFCVVENWKQQRAWAVGYGPWVRSVFLKNTHTHKRTISSLFWNRSNYHKTFIHLFMHNFYRARTTGHKHLRITN